MVLPAVKQWSTERIQACLLADPPCRRVRQRATTRRGGRVRPQLLIHCRHRSSPVASPVSLTLEAAKAVLRSSAVVRRAHISSRHSGRMDRTAAFPRCDASDQPNEGQLEWRAADEVEHVAADLLECAAGTWTSAAGRAVHIGASCRERDPLPVHTEPGISEIRLPASHAAGRSEHPRSV